MQAVLQLFSKPSKIPPARGLRGNKKEQNCICIHEKVIPRCERLIYDAEE